MAAAYLYEVDPEHAFPYDVPYRVALVGHSQLPRELNVPYPGIELRIFRAPGARATNFESRARLRDALAWKHDLTILWIGSNDITTHTIPNDLAHDIQAIITNFESQCGSEVSIVLIEPRLPDPRFGHNPSSEAYRLIADGVNRRLIRRNRNRYTLSMGARPFVAGLGRDGVHWARASRAHVNEKITKFIMRSAHHHFKIRMLGGMMED